ncbi:MAG TPA: hypothetical protein VGA31_13375 [Thermoanaerobaculia bacterium]
MKTPWEKFSLPGDRPAFARGESAEFRKVLRETFGPLVDRVEEWPSGPQEWLMAEVPAEGSLMAFLRDLKKRLASPGSLWVVFPKKPFLEELSFPYSWTDVQKAGLACGLVDNKIAAFSARLTSIRFVIPIAFRKSRLASGR